MSPELRDLLHGAATEVRSGDTDLDDIRRRAVRIRRGRRIRNGIATLAVVALAVPAVNVARSLLPDRNLVIEQPDPTESATPGPRTDLGVIEGMHQLALADDRLYGVSVHGVVVSDDAGETWSLVVAAPVADHPAVKVAAAASGQAVALLAAVVLQTGDLALDLATTEDGAAWERATTVVDMPGQLPVDVHDVEVHRTPDRLYVTVQGDAQDAAQPVPALDIYTADGPASQLRWVATLEGAERAAFGPDGFGAAAGLGGPTGLQAWSTTDAAETWSERTIDAPIGAPYDLLGPIASPRGATFAVVERGADGPGVLRVLEVTPSGEDVSTSGERDWERDGAYRLARAGDGFLVATHEGEGTRLYGVRAADSDQPMLADLVGDGTNVFAVTESGAYDRTEVLRSTDNGQTWRTVASRTLGGESTSPPSTIEVRRRGVALDGFAWSLRSDGIWDERAQELLPFPEFVPVRDIGSVHFTDADHGWALVSPIEAGLESGAYLHVTEDGAATWTGLPVDLPAVDGMVDWSVADIEVLEDGTIVLAVPRGMADGTDRGTDLARSRDGGQTWEHLGRAPGSGVTRFSAADIAWSVVRGGDGVDDTMWRLAVGEGDWTEVALQGPPARATRRLLDLAFHEATADAIGVHVSADRGPTFATYTFGSPWTYDEVAVPSDADLPDDPSVAGWTSVSVGAAWWIVQAPGGSMVTITTERAAASSRGFQPVGRWFTREVPPDVREVVTAFAEGCRCIVSLVSDDGYLWEPWPRP